MQVRYRWATQFAALWVLVICGFLIVRIPAPGNSAPVIAGSDVVTINGTACWLENAEERNREYPDTFPIPAQDDRCSLQKGQIVKLMIAIDTNGEIQVERMWVIVSGVDGTDYSGILDNDPYSTDSFGQGTNIEFGPEHVIQIHKLQSSQATGD